MELTVKPVGVVRTPATEQEIKAEPQTIQGKLEQR